MTTSGTDPGHFTKVVTQLGEKRPVVTTQAIFSDRGVKILDKGAAVHAGLYERIMAHRLAEPLEQSVSSLPSVTGAVLRSQAELALLSVPLLARLARDPAVRRALLDALERIPLPAPMAFQLTLAFEVRPALFRHGVYTALVAAWLAMGPMASRFEVGQAAMAGLLHDIGMLHLDPALLDPAGSIGREQRRQLYSHPLVSTALMERHHEYPREAVRAVREHHEFLNGSGYPGHLPASAISPLGRVLGLAELVSPALSRKQPATELRLSVMLRLNTPRYDAALVARLLGQLAPQEDPQANPLPLLPDAVARLRQIHATLLDWPAELSRDPAMAAHRRAGMAAVDAQAAELRRAMATVGATPLQLAQLGDDTPDAALHRELTLLAGEAAWQLRALARQFRRRWRLAPDEVHPPRVKDWLDRVDTLVAAIGAGGNASAA